MYQVVLTPIIKHVVIAVQLSFDLFRELGFFILNPIKSASWALVESETSVESFSLLWRESMRERERQRLLADRTPLFPYIGTEKIISLQDYRDMWARSCGVRLAIDDLEMIRGAFPGSDDRNIEKCMVPLGEFAEGEWCRQRFFHYRWEKARHKVKAIFG